METSGSVEFQLDLTNAHLHDLRDVSILDSLTVDKSLNLTCNRLSSIEPRLQSLKGLRRLSFRQNLLRDASEVAMLESKSGLESLDLRDNQYHEIPSLVGFSNLKFLEVSYNEIRSMQPLSQLSASSLDSLYLASNKITSIENLFSFPNLKTLELGFNRIRQIENISHLTQLEEIWLGRNRITEIQNLDQLQSLKKISLQSNRLTTISGLESCILLEELYLSHNGVSRLEVRSQADASFLMFVKRLDMLCELKVLDVSNNRITHLECLENLKKLEDLWLNNNQLDDWNELDKALEGPKATLSTIYFENNPIVGNLSPLKSVSSEAFCGVGRSPPL